MSFLCGYLSTLVLIREIRGQNFMSFLFGYLSTPLSYSYFPTFCFVALLESEEINACRKAFQGYPVAGERGCQHLLAVDGKNLQGGVGCN